MLYVCPSIRSTTSTVLTTLLVAETYRYNGSFTFGATSMGGVVSIRLRPLSTSSASGVHSNLSAFFISRYNGSAFLPSLLTNRLSAATVGPVGTRVPMDLSATSPVILGGWIPPSPRSERLGRPQGKGPRGALSTEDRLGRQATQPSPKEMPSP